MNWDPYDPVTIGVVVGAVVMLVIVLIICIVYYRYSVTRHLTLDRTMTTVPGTTTVATDMTIERNKDMGMTGLSSAAAASAARSAAAAAQGIKKAREKA